MDIYKEAKASETEVTRKEKYLLSDFNQSVRRKLLAEKVETMAHHETVLVSSTCMSLMQDPIVFSTGQNNDMTYLYPENTPSCPRFEVN